jgi:hypothetical protein
MCPPLVAGAAVCVLSVVVGAGVLGVVVGADVLTETQFDWDCEPSILEDVPAGHSQQ